MLQALPEGRVLPANQIATIKSTLSELRTWCGKSGFQTLDATLTFALKDLESDEVKASDVVSRLVQLDESLRYDAAQRSFWLVHGKKLHLFDAAFGDEVEKAFPDATSEIKEAGSCYALARNTAAVFHLMRAAEHGLRGFVIAVGISTPAIPLEYQQWQALIEQFASLSKVAVDKWPEPMRTNARAFFSRVIADFFAFKDDVRNVCMHTRTGGTYDGPGALSVRNRVVMSSRLSATVLEAERVFL